MSPASPHHTSSATRSRQQARRYRSLERVRLRRDLPEHGLKRGARGTIVHVLEPTDEYLVEFVSATDGSTRALAELTPDQLRALGR
jgi:Domain of unknown function (DUF4926)